MKEAMKTANEVVMKMVDEEGSPVVVEEVDLVEDPPVIGFDEASLERKLRMGVSTLYHYASVVSPGLPGTRHLLVRTTRLAPVPWRLWEARVHYRWLTQIAECMASRDCVSSVSPSCTRKTVYSLTYIRIDASVFPVPISANTQAPVYALAEKVADAILREHPFVPSQSKS
jgi:hypothetical protein